MTLEEITTVYNNFFNGQMSTFVHVARFLGAIIFAVTLGKEIFKTFSQSGKILGHGNDGFTPYELIRGIAMLGLILAIPELLTLVDLILIEIDAVAMQNYSQQLELTALANTMGSLPEDATFEDMMLFYLEKVIHILNPVNVINGPLYIVAWLIDQILWMIFIAQRFFLMGVIKVVSPIIVAISIEKRFRDLAYNLTKVYLRYFLVIIPYLLVFAFVKEIHDALIPGAEVGITAGDFLQGSSRTAAIIGVVVLKIMLLKKATSIMKELIP